jgi:AcrR family transcriptional regulator
MARVVKGRRGRPVKHDRDAMLDAALQVLVDRGARAVSASAVAGVLDAPSGSIYHRFGSRDGLLAALWLRSVERFQRGFAQAVENGDPHQAALAGARHVFTWSRHERAEALLLARYRLVDLLDDPVETLPLEDRQRDRAQRRRVSDALQALAEQLGCDLPRVTLAVVDLPLAAVRRPLTAGQPIEQSLERLVLEGAETLLSAGARPRRIVP